MVILVLWYNDKEQSLSVRLRKEGGKHFAFFPGFHALFTGPTSTKNATRVNKSGFYEHYL